MQLHKCAQIYRLSSQQAKGCVFHANSRVKGLHSYLFMMPSTLLGLWHSHVR